MIDIIIGAISIIGAIGLVLLINTDNRSELEKWEDEYYSKIYSQDKD